MREEEFLEKKRISHEKKMKREEEIKREYLVEEGKLDEKNRLNEEKWEAVDLHESQRISLARINEPISFKMYENKEYFPKKGNEVVLDYLFLKENAYTVRGIVSNVTETGFTVLNYEHGNLENVTQLIKMKKEGSCTITKLKPDSSEDCLVSFRNEALDFVRNDFSKIEIVSIRSNPYAIPGNPAFDVFCKFLQKDYPVMMAYHGTARRNVPAILQSRIEAGGNNLYGKGAYFTTNPMKAFDYGSEKNAVGYAKNSEIRDILACALSLNPENYDFADTKRPLDEIVNSDVVSNIPLFHLRVRHSGAYSTALPAAHETFLFDPSNEQTAVFAAHLKNFHRIPR